MRVTILDGQTLDLYLLEGASDDLEHPDNLSLMTELQAHWQKGQAESQSTPFFSLPGKMEVCERCEGKGVHDHPAFSNGFTSDEMHEAGPDFQEEYMAGHYDVTCSECKGEKVNLVIDSAVIEKGSAAEELAEVCASYWTGKWEMDAEQAAERRMGA